MNWNPYPPLPLCAVRDLLGITRAMYRATVLDDPRNVCRLQVLEDIGRTLRAVLAAHGTPRGTIAHLEAWAAAERATQALGELVGESLKLAPLVAATARRVSRGRQTMG